MRLEPHRLVFIDETAVTTKMTRLRGRSARGTRLEADAPFGHWRTQTFIAGLRIDELSAPWVLDGPMNRAAFDQFGKRPVDLKRCADALVAKRVKNIIGA